jgi:hypothetical protein
MLDKIAASMIAAIVTTLGATASDVGMPHDEPNAAQASVPPTSATHHSDVLGSSEIGRLDAILMATDDAVLMGKGLLGSGSAVPVYVAKLHGWYELRHTNRGARARSV